MIKKKERKEGVDLKKKKKQTKTNKNLIKIKSSMMRSYNIILCAILFISCGSNTQETYHSFNHNEWNSDSINLDI